MPPWSEQVEEELTTLIKDWLKHKGLTQADLRNSLQAVSTRMPALIDVLRKEYSLGGITKVASRLCEIEQTWSNQNTTNQKEAEQFINPFGQLDMLLQEIRDDCDEKH